MAPSTPVNLTDEQFREFMEFQKSSGAKGGPAGDGSSLGTLQNVLLGVVDTGAKASKGQLDLNEAVGLATKAITAIPVAGNFLGGTFGTVAAAGLELNTTLNYINKESGVNFGNRLGEMSELMTGARMSTAELQETFRKASPYINGFGGNMNDAGRTLLKFDKDVQETQVGVNLKIAGIQAKELNEIALVTQYRNTRLGLLDEQQRKAAAESTAKFAEQLDLSARLFGKSREAQLKDVQAQQEKANVQAALSQMDQGARVRFVELQGTINTLGPKFQDLTSDIVVNGQARSQESVRIMALLGNAGTQYQQAVLNYQNATTPAAKAAAERELEAAKLAVSKRMQEDDYIDAVRYNTGELGKLGGEIRQGNLEFQSVEAAKNKAAQEEADSRRTWTKAEQDARVAAILAENKATAEKERAGKKKDGTPDPEAALGRTLNNLTITITDFQAGFGTAVRTGTKSIGEELVKSGSEIHEAVKKYLVPRTQEYAASQLGKLTPSSIFGSANPKDRGNYNPADTAVPHATGSLGNFGEFFHNYGPEGFPATLHGEEMVLPKGQLPQFLNQFKDQMKGVGGGLNSKDFESIIQNVTQQGQGALQEAGKSLPGLAQNLQSSIGSAFSGGATGGNDLLNDIKKEMISLNTHIQELIKFSSDTASNTANATRVIKANGNRLG